MNTKQIIDKELSSCEWTKLSTLLTNTIIILAGSAGTAVITTDKALLFTDGRYHNQAEIELGSEWTLMKQGAALYDVIWLSGIGGEGRA